MTKRAFSDSERFVLWKHFSQRCYWCHEPLTLRDTTIDHVIPESLLNKPSEFTAVKTKYGLSEDFELNSFENWLPTHDRCNRSKSNKVFDPAPVLIDILRTLQREAPTVRAAEKRLHKERKVEAILGRLIIDVKNATIDREEILAAFADPDLKNNSDAKVLEREFELHIDPLRWKLVGISGTVGTVSDGRRGGMTPTGKSPDPSWVCPTCGSYGPWNGVICLNCGRMSDPSD